MLKTRHDRLPLACVLVAVLAGSLWGCNEADVASVPSDTSGNDEKPSTAESTTQQSPVKPLLDGWAKPAAALVLSGEQHGYVEPCGCSATQSGGLARRDDLFRQIKERGWSCVGLDLGGLIKRNREQTRLKFRTMVDALKTLGYQAMALGPQELRLGADQLLALHTYDSNQSEEGLAFLGANTVLFDTPDLGTPQPWRIVKVGDVRVGVMAVLGNAIKDKMFPEGAHVDISFTDPKEAIKKTLPGLKAEEPDLLVLLSHASVSESEELARAFPEFKLVFSASDVEDPLYDNPKYVGDTMVAAVGHKGKYVGVVGFYPDEEKRPVRFELVDLDKWRFKEGDAMRAYMKSYQDQLRDFHILTGAARELIIPHPRGTEFVGAEVCAECHSQAYDQWLQTGHSHAYESLIKGRPEKEATWVSRVNDPECIACHVVGWHTQDVVPYISGFVDIETTEHLKGVQCENCHGPGSRHVELAENDELTAKNEDMIVTIEEAKQRLCFSCHDLDNSPEFDFDTYWPKVEHHGVD